MSLGFGLDPDIWTDDLDKLTASDSKGVLYAGFSKSNTLFFFIFMDRFGEFNLCKVTLGKGKSGSLTALKTLPKYWTEAKNLGVNWR